MTSSPNRRALCWLVLAAGLSACFGSWGRPSKAPGHAAWASDAAALEGVDMAALQTGGIKEIFFEAGALEWSGPSPHVKIQPLPVLARGINVTLVVSGDWPVSLGDSKHAGSRLADEIKRLDLDAQARGIFPTGVHLDLDARGNLTSYAQGLRAMRGEIRKNLSISVSVERDWLSDVAVEKVARSVDYIVAFLYGQRPGEAENTAAWDFQAVVSNLRKVEDLKSPYMIGVVTVGVANHLGARGEPLAATTEIALRDLVGSPALQLQGGFTLEGIDRTVYDFRAERAARAGPWSMQRGESVRVVGTGSGYVQGLRKRVTEVATTHHLGEVFYRLPHSGEALTLTAAALTDALGGNPPALDLVLSAELIEKNSQHWVVKVVLEKANEQRSDIAMLNNNFVDVACDNALIGAVQIGQFQRFELLRKDSDAVDMAALRTPERARLYLPILESKGRYESGPIEVLLKGRDAKLTLSASFLMPDGQTVAAPSVVWTPPAK